MIFNLNALVHKIQENKFPTKKKSVHPHVVTNSILVLSHHQQMLLTYMITMYSVGTNSRVLASQNLLWL